MEIDRLKLLIEDIGSACIANHIKYKHKELYENIIRYSNSISSKDFKFSERLYLFINQLKNIPYCKICGKETKYLDYTRGYQDTCSRKCSHKDIERVDNMKRTCMDRYGNVTATGTDSYKEKTKKTCKHKYGTEHHLSKGSSVRKKIENTNKIKYGGISPFSNNELQDKWKNNFIEKYGTNNPMRVNDIKNKSIKTRQEFLYDTIIMKFKNSLPQFTKDVYLSRGFGYDVIYQWKCSKCENTFDSYYANGVEPSCPKCYPKYRSKAESEIKEFIIGMGYDVKSNVRDLLKNMEIDITIPSMKIAIEFNGNFYHSELAGKDKNYHLSKTEGLEKIGWSLIHIFEDEWLNKKPIIKAKIKSKLKKQKYKIYARKCKVREIGVIDKNNFLDKYHIQGADKSNIKLGLFYNDKLIAVMTFCKARKILGYKNTENLWELSRYASLNMFNIVGGAGKLLSYFINMNKGSKIISYADRRFTNINNNVYSILGFELSHISPPNYFYIHSNNYLERLSRLKFQKHKLVNILEKFDSNKTEWNNMKDNSFNRIWDCGNLVYILEI